MVRSSFSVASLVVVGALLGTSSISPGHAADEPRHGPRESRPAVASNATLGAVPALRLPLDVIVVSSGYGMRADPFDQPPPGGQPVSVGAPRPAPLPFGIGARGAKTNVATRKGAAAGLAPQPVSTIPGPRPAGMGGMFLHEGVDLAAPTGTPIYAAADGTVSGAGPNGGYGNWIRIEHSASHATVYGHLSNFASGIAAGAVVSEGQLIGYVGSTGRSTGPHLHFEILINGRAVDPLAYPGIRRTRLVAQQ